MQRVVFKAGHQNTHTFTHRQPQDLGIITDTPQWKRKEEPTSVTELEINTVKYRCPHLAPISTLFPLQLFAASLTLALSKYLLVPGNVDKLG
jgi:hypothetical protein